MFSLIITLVAIALVAVLALATLYYGGAAFNSSSLNAKAGQVVVQGQQILAAAELFYLRKQRWPNSMSELTAADALSGETYLKTNPSIGMADSGVGQWSMPTAGVPTFVLSSSVRAPLCQRINLRTRGDDGIYKKAWSTFATQCYGDTSTSFTAVVTKSTSEGLATALPGQTGTGSSPNNNDLQVWTVSPGADSGTWPDGGGTVGPIIISDGHVDFGDGMSGSIVTRTITLTNKSSDSAPLSSIDITGEGFSADSTCGSSLGAGAACSVSFTLVYPAEGRREGKFKFSTGDLHYTGGLTGSTVALLPVLSLSPAPYDFGEIYTGESRSQVFTLGNGGSAPATVSGASLSGNAAFTLSSNTCTANRVLGPGQSCAMTVTYKSTTSTSVSTTLTVTTDAKPRDYTAAISGRSIAAEMRFCWTGTDSAHNTGIMSVNCYDTAEPANMDVVEQMNLRNIGDRYWAGTDSRWEYSTFYNTGCPNLQPGNATGYCAYSKTVESDFDAPSRPNATQTIVYNSATWMIYERNCVRPDGRFVKKAAFVSGVGYTCAQ